MRLRHVNQHLGRRFRIQCKLKCKSYSIDSAALHQLLNGIVWCDNWSEPAPSPRVVLAKAFIDVPPFSSWQRHSKLILPAPCLCVSADNASPTTASRKPAGAMSFVFPAATSA